MRTKRAMKGSKGGGNESRAGSKVREVTRDLYSSLIFDAYPSPETLTDFGITSRAHYEALHYAVRDHGVTPDELDEALGNGTAITALIRRGNPHHGIEFRTSWDGIPPGSPMFASRHRLWRVIEDGRLVDVTRLAKVFAFAYPVALTAAAWAACVAVPEGVEGEDEEGRLFAVLWTCPFDFRRGYQSEVLYRVYDEDDREGGPPPVTLKAVCGLGDDRAPAMTIMLPDED